jgi:hypothetical protein
MLISLGYNLGKMAPYLGLEQMVVHQLVHVFMDFDGHGLNLTPPEVI